MQNMQQITGRPSHQLCDTSNPQLTIGPAVSKLNDAILALDLDPIKIKLMGSDDGEGWSRAKAEAVDTEYRRFLHLGLEPHRVPIVPTKDVDKFWHYHILDTMKYADDCNAIFGRFLHHFPYFGLRGEDDARNLRQAAAQTRLLYRQTFGEDAPGLQSAAGREEHCTTCQPAAAGCGAVVCEVGECHMVQFSRPKFEN